MFQLVAEPYLVESNNNLFNLRNINWYDKIVYNVSEMLKAGEKYGITVKSITLNKVEQDKHKFELRKTLSKMLTIILEHNGKKEVELCYEIPWLVNNHFYIGGNRKIGLYQLYDIPTIKRDNIKIRTNICTLVLYKKTSNRSEYNYYLSYSSRELPFAYYLLAYLGIDKVKEVFGISDEGMIENDGTSENVDYFDLLTDICKAIQTNTNEYKSFLSSYYNRRDDKDIINDILLITDVDIFSKQYFETDNILEEFVHVIKNGTPDDLNYMNKRVRFTEHLVYYHLCKEFYNMITTLKKSKRNRFKSNSKGVLINANSSPVVQYDFSLNPLGELALLSRVSLSGPGGFEKNNVPSYLRDIHSSMYGKICPADTGDRDNCGTSQYLVPTIELNSDMSFKEQSDDCINSIAISHVPLLEHDDPTRLQMASSQQRHAIMLNDFDLPYIQSGVEGLYTSQTSFMFKAERDGKIVYKDDSVIIAQYDNKECKAFNIGYKKLFLSICDLYSTNFDVGQSFNAGDIIAESNYLEDGRLTIGRNLKTAVMVYYGYNYEDGIVISDSLVKDNKMTSVHYLDLSFELSPNKVLLNLNDNNKEYKPIPSPGDVFKKGDVYSKIKTISGYGDNKDVIFDDSHDLKSTEDCIVVDVKIYANKWNTEFSQYNDFITSFMKSKQKERDNLIEVLSEYLTSDEIDNFIESLETDKTDKSRRNYRLKGDSIDGIRIEITAIYNRPITIGDKIGNRHGNKGIVSKIVPEKDMPVLDDGSRAEVIINPLGIISRMNIGQLFELHLSQSVYDLKQQLLNLLTESKLDLVKKKIHEYVDIIDCTSTKYYLSQVDKQISKADKEELFDIVNNFYVIQPPFESIKIDQLHKALQYTNTKFEYDCYDPELDNNKDNRDQNYFNKNIKNPISAGYMYFIKMNHIAKDKIASRSVGPYTTKTAQPIDGKGRKGGQRLGEMEVWAVAGHGATTNLMEMLTVKSDSIKKRNGYISHMVNNDDILLDEEDPVSQANRLFQSMLRSIGLHYPIKEDYDE